MVVYACMHMHVFAWMDYACLSLHPLVHKHLSAVKEQARTASIVYSDTETINSTERHAELDSQQSEID